MRSNNWVTIVVVLVILVLGAWYFELFGQPATMTSAPATVPATTVPATTAPATVPVTPPPAATPAPPPAP